MPPTPQPMSSPLADAAHRDIHNIAGPLSANKQNDAPASNANTTARIDTIVNAPVDEKPEKPYVSKVSVLTSSLTVYHNAFMAARKKDAQRVRLQEQGEPLESHEVDMLSKLSPATGQGERSSEQQAETIRHLKPHSRSSIQLQNITSQPILQEGGVVLDMKPKSKQKTTKWQFGIRSRNEPVDAIKCLYRALISMGDCQWQISPPKDHSQSNGESGPFPVAVQGATHLPTADQNLSESPEKERHHMRQSPPIQQTNHDSNDLSRSRNHKDSVNGSTREDSESELDEDVDVSATPEGYVPKDPWCINVRWEKKGMSPPGAGSSSAQSSAIDLQSNDGQARRGSLVMNSLGSSTGSTTSVGLPEGVLNADTACFVYLDLQIYVLEQDVYLVDFKNSGYEPIVGTRKVTDKKGEVVSESIGNGQRMAEKEVTSPQPFLDLANKLVIHLAKGANQ